MLCVVAQQGFVEVEECYHRHFLQLGLQVFYFLPILPYLLAIHNQFPQLLPLRNPQPTQFNNRRHIIPLLNTNINQRSIELIIKANEQ